MRTRLPILAVLLGCSVSSDAQHKVSQFPLPEGAVFIDATEDSGLRFKHVNGMSGNYYLPEITGAGGAFFDFDNDGDLDIYFVQGTLLSGEKGAGPKEPSGHRLTDRLYRNDLHFSSDRTPEVRFTDITAEAGLEDESGYGMGVTTGDFDNDGWVDLYVTNFGSNRMLRNRGNGTFSEVTAKAGTDDIRWSTSATFFDYNGDGWLDLYVANYVDFTIAGKVPCYAVSSAVDYCGPDAYQPEGDRLFRNRGDGTFEDVTSSSGIYKEKGAGLGVIASDFNGDGWIDLYVANDGDPNVLWINQKDGTFSNDALLSGVALNDMGAAEASMGVDAADFDNDGDEDLFITHIKEETNTLYLNEGNAFFEDRTIEVQLALPSVRNTSFGTVWVDYDNDGWLDLIVLNGAVTIIEELARIDDPYPLHQRNQLFRNLGNGSFVETTGQGGTVFDLSEVSRGAAVGDVDNDGDADVLILNNNGPARLLLNQIGNRRNWIGLRLVSTRFRRDMLGAGVEILIDSGRKRFRRVRSDGSYCSSRDPRILVGLSDAKSVTAVNVTWPDGRSETWSGLAIDRYHLLEQGKAGTE